MAAGGNTDLLASKWVGKVDVIVRRRIDRTTLFLHVYGTYAYEPQEVFPRDGSETAFCENIG